MITSVNILRFLLIYTLLQTFFVFAFLFVIIIYSMNIPTTIIVMGRSGSGKGTQIALLKQHLNSHNHDVYHFESGNLFREMIKGEGYTSDKLREFLKTGALVPDFFTDWLLVNGLVENLNSKAETLILDGYPRTRNQAETLDQALEYYQRNSNVVVLHIEVSEEEVRRRMIERGRGDDINREAVENRIHFYNQEVLPTLASLRMKDNYSVIDINGEGNIDDIQAIVKKALNIN
jgi:adenylate kinase